MITLLKPKEVADRLRVTPAMVYMLVDQGKIGSYRVNSAVRISEEDLEKYLQSRRLKPVTN